MHVWKKSQRSNAIIIRFRFLIFFFSKLWKVLLRSRTKSKKRMLFTIQARYNRSTAGFFVHTSLACWRDSHQTSIQHSTGQETHVKQFWKVQKGNWMTVHTRRTQVSLHYCSLLFHCLISQRLINMHAFLGFDMMRAAFLHQTQVYCHAFGVHIRKQCAAVIKKGQREARSRGEIIHQMPRQFLATQISGTVRGKRWTWYQFSMLLMDHHVKCLKSEEWLNQC